MEQRGNEKMEMNVERRIILGKGSTEIEVNDSKKIFTITLTGQFDSKSMTNFFKIYSECTKQLNLEEYNLVINCKLLGVFQAHLIEDVRAAYRHYRKFKSISIINPINNIGRIQLERIAREDNHLTYTNFIN